MLTGSVVVDGHKLNIRGYDLGTSFALTVTAQGNDRAYFDAGHSAEAAGSRDQDIFSDDGRIAPQWNNQRPLGLTVGPSSIKVETFPVISKSFDEKLGRSKTTKTNNEVNKDAFGAVGSILRGMKNQCVPANILENPLSMFNDVVETDIRTYTVNGGEVTLTQGIVTALKYNSSRIQIELHDIGDGYDPVPFVDNSINIRLNLSGFSTKGENYGLIETTEEYYTIEEIIELNKGKKNYGWVLEQSYHMVDDIVKFKELMKRLWEFDGDIAFDTETTGLFINHRSNEGIGDKLVGMVFSLVEGESYYVPIAHKLFSNVAGDEHIAYLMETYVKPVLETKNFIGHNISFDWKVMWAWGINCNFVGDTMTAIELTLNKEKGGYPLSLKAASARMFQRDSFELSDMVVGGGSWDDDKNFADLPYASVKWYACADTDNTLAIWNWFKKNRILDKYAVWPVFKIEVKFSMCIGYSEYYGMHADPANVETLEAELIEHTEDLMRQMEEIVGRKFKPSSSNDLVQVMFQELGMPVVFMTQEGGDTPSTNKDVLKILMGYTNPDGSPKYPFVHLLKEWKDANTLITNFVKNFNKLAIDGFFHSSVRQFLETGRVSITKPNYQSFNDAVKRYITPRKGFYMFDTDFSSIEYRVLVSMAGEGDLIDQFQDPDFDYHRRMASMLHNVPYEKVTPELRGQSKGLNFGIPYGMSIIGLAQRMFGSKDKKAINKAQGLYSKYFDVQPKVKMFFEDVKDQAVNESYNSTFFGRRRAYNKDQAKVSRIRRQAGNHPIQGTAADIYKLGVGRIFDTLVERGYLGKILLTGFVHDETVIECHKSINPAELLSIVSNAMMVDLEGWCPLYIGAGFGESWYQAKKTELPVQVQTAIQEAGPAGMDWWDGDTSKLIEWEEYAIGDFNKNSALEYIRNEENWEKPIGLVASGWIEESLKIARKGARIHGVVVDASSIELPGELTDQALEFGRVFGVLDEVERADFILAPETEDVKGVDYDDLPEIRPDDIVFDEEAYITTRVSSAQEFGASILDRNDAMLIKANNTNTDWNTIVMRLISASEGSSKIYLVVAETGELIETDKTGSPMLCSQVIAAHSKMVTQVKVARW